MTITEQAVEAANELDSLYAQCAIKDRYQNAPTEFDDGAWYRFDSAARRAWPKITAAIRTAAQPLMGVQRPEDVARALLERILPLLSAVAEGRSCMIAAGDLRRDVAAVLALPHTGQPQEVASEEFVKNLRSVLRNSWTKWGTYSIEFENATVAAILAVSAAPASPQRAEGDHERETPVVKPIGQERS